MKNLYFLLLLSLLGPAHLWAQTTDSLRLKLDYLVAPLDKSQVPSGRLDAYATPLVPLAAFNGQLAAHAIPVATYRPSVRWSPSCGPVLAPAYVYPPFYPLS